MPQLSTSVLFPLVVAVVMFLAAAVLAAKLRRERAAARDRMAAEERAAVERLKRQLARRTDEPEQRQEPAAAPEPYRRRTTGPVVELPPGPYSEENPVPGLATAEDGPSAAEPPEEEAEIASPRPGRPASRRPASRRWQGSRPPRRPRKESGSSVDGQSGSSVDGQSGADGPDEGPARSDPV